LPFLGTDPNGTWSLFIRDDTGGDAGSLLGWSISIEPESARPRLSSPRVLPNGQLQITLQGLQSVTHVIEASSNLVSWTPLTFLPSGSETIVYPADRQFRFYRAVCCP
jgi:hypothetical protein